MGTTGSKYESALRTVEIARRIRADIKAAVAEGTLPKARYSVRTGGGSMHSTIDVTIGGLPFALFVREGWIVDAAGNAQWGDRPWWLARTPAAKAVEEQVEAIVCAYRRDDSDIQVDYFNCNFYETVRFDREDEQRERAEIAADIRAPKANDQVSFLAALGVEAA